MLLPHFLPHPFKRLPLRGQVRLDLPALDLDHPFEPVQLSLERRIGVAEIVDGG